jgi:ABC-type transporter Mla subunit MlaD
MALQDLTPQLRTRLSRVERAVGIFVGLATLLLLAGFAYYLHHTAERKGWFKVKAPFFTYVDDATGLNVGAPVKMMGFNVGEITRITAEDPNSIYNVYVEFYVQGEFIGYIWTDSRVKVVSADFLGGRHLEVLKGAWNGWTNADGSIKDLKPVFQHKNEPEDLTLTGIWLDKEGRYDPFTKTNKPYWLIADEAPALTRQAERLIGQAESALPVILSLTNQLYTALNNFMTLSSNLDLTIAGIQPVVSNVTTISTRLTGGPGSLGEMLLPTNLNAELVQTIATARQTLTNLDRTLSSATQTLAGAGSTFDSANQTLLTARTMVTNTDARLELLVSNLNLSLIELSGITSNLHQQVQVNTNILSEISSAIVTADELMEGLKKHWLLRSAFKDKSTNQPPLRPPDDFRGGLRR